MPGDSIGTAFVDVAFDPKQIQGQVGGLGGKLTGGFGKLGSLAGAAMVTGVGAAIAGGVAVGKYLYDVGAQFDDMSDTIRASTGKTGKDLDALVKTAKGVGTDVPASFKDAGTAVASLSTRLGLTGKPLRDVSDQVLELARLSGTDLPTALNSVTRMLGDAGLKGADASKGIDKLWRASQATQVPVSRLADLLTKFGGPMRQLGFSFEEQAALLGKFEKEGVNTELVMGSMRIALGKMAKAGKDPVKALRETMKAIKDTGDAGKANRLAIELFGARAGPDMAAAIREGRFSIDDLVKTIKGGRDTVMKASKDTMDFSEQWKLFKNRVAVAVAPAAEKMFSAVGQGMALLNKEMPTITKTLKSELGPALSGLGPDFAVIGQAIKDLLPLWKILGDVVLSNMRLVIASVKGFFDILAGTIKVVRGLLTGDWSLAWQGAKQVVDGFVTYFRAILQTGILGVLTQLAGPVKGAAVAVGKAIYDGILAGVSTIVRLCQTAFDGVRNAINSAISGVKSAATAVGTAITTGVTTVLNTLGRLTSTAFNAVVGAIRAALSAVSSAATAIGRAIVDGVMRLVNTVRGLVTGALHAVAGAASGAAAAIGSAIVAGLRGSLGGVYAAVKGGLDRIWKAISAVAGAAAGAAAGIGYAIVSGVISGLGSFVSRVGGEIASKAKGAIDWAKGHVGSTAEEYAKAQIGDPIMAGVVRGVVLGEKPLSDAVAKTVASAVEAGRSSIAAGRDKFASSFGEVASGVLDAFDKMKAGLKTKSETLLASMELDRRVAEMKAAIVSAQDELTAARAAQAALAPQAEGESDADFAARQEAAKQRVVAAEKALGDAKYEQQKANLEKQAAAERVQLDARLALQRSHLEAALAAQGKAFATGNVSADKAQAALIKTLNAYGVKYTAAGKTLGSSFVTGLNQTIGKSMTDLEGLLKRIRDAIAGVTAANAGVKPKTAAAAAAGPAAFGVAALGATGPSLQAGAPSGGTLYGTRSPFASVTQAIRSAGRSAAALEPPPTIVRVFIGDEELRGIVRTEVGYADDATARVVLAGMSR